MRFITAALAVCLGVAGGCSNHETPVPGEACVVNSDCKNPLSCTFGLCHEACRDNADCPQGQRCVAGAAGVRVCLLEPRCAFDSACPAPLVCGRDLQCRNQCEADLDCPNPGDTCVVGGPGGEKVCAEAAAVEGGMVKGAPAPSAADAGAPGSENTGPTGGADAGVADTAAGEAVAGANPCGIEEPEPNDQHANASGYQLGSRQVGCLGAVKDVDYYQVTAPAGDPGGGFMVASISDVGDGAVFARVHTASDNGQVQVVQTLTRGMSLQLYWAAAPGQSYHVVVLAAGLKPFGPFRYTLAVDYTPVDDAHEPNDTRDGPRPLVAGTPVSGFLFAGFRTARMVHADYQDWFSTDLVGGPARVNIEGIPADARVRFRMFDANHVELRATGATNANLGADIAGSLMIPAAGSYRLLVEPVGSLVATGTGASLPDSFTRAYKLTVSQ